MKTTQKSISLGVASAFALTIGAATTHAAENPFAIKLLSSGYQVADAATSTKMKESIGKSGASKKMAEKTNMVKDATEKSAEGSCSADKMKDGSCSATMKSEVMTDKMSDKAKDGSCHAEMKGKEGSCHSDKK